MVKVQKDLTGQIFGRLKVIKQVEDYISPKGIHAAQWLCECNCDAHNEIIATGGNLRSGSVKSCGCLAKEKSSEKAKQNIKTNRYDLDSESYAIGYTSKDEPFYFDKEDYDKIKNYCWYYDKRGYLVSNERGTRKRTLFHRIIMEPVPEKMEVDHKKHPPRHEHKSDNRKENLEIKTNSQNMMNAHLYSHNTSGVSGVTYTKASNKWQVRIGVNGKRIHLGYFDSFEEAVQVRKEAEEKYFGNYRFDECNK